MSGHLGPRVSDYVDRRLDAATMAALDRHVVACQVCRAAADEERQLLASLRQSPGLSAGLQQLLLGLAAAPPSQEGPPVTVPPVPVASRAVRDLRLPVVAPAAPALHRSPLRATLLAGFAASASAAIAWGLTAPSAPAGVDRTPVTPVRGLSSGSVVQAAFAPGTVESFTLGSTRSARTTEPSERFGR
ncbi:MAG: zf-HC2 domain-containing protein [Dermatophilaceae bacterium]